MKLAAIIEYTPDKARIAARVCGVVPLSRIHKGPCLV